MRTILHMDMDAFFASVEQRDHPDYRGKPVIVGAPPDKRGVVSTCSYEARAYGVHSAMPSREAFRRCPHAIFVRGDMTRYTAVSQQVFAILDRFSPFVEGVSCDEAFLDITGSHHLFGGPAETGHAIRAAIANELHLPASVGIAPNKLLAKLASETAKPNGLFLTPTTPEAIATWLAPKPIGALWGVGKTTEALLSRAGIHTIRDIQTCDRRLLVNLLGERAADALHAFALGEDDSPVAIATTEKSISREHTFLEDCTNRAQIRDTLTHLIADVAARLRTTGYYARVGRIKLRDATFRTITRQAQFTVPACDDFTFREIAYRLFDAAISEFESIRLIGFGVSDFTDTQRVQLSLFDNVPETLTKRERLFRALDALTFPHANKCNAVPRHADDDTTNNNDPCGTQGEENES